jgi:trehalose 6-phosphate phosphatase
MREPRDFEMSISEARKLPAPPSHLLDQASLFLDFDGTLVEIAARPDAVSVERRLHDLIRRLQGFLGGRLAIVSGRAAANVCALFDGLSVTVAGSHGGELRWPGGRAVTAPAPRFDAVARALLQGLRQRHPGVLVEEKPLGLALHFRQAPQAEEDCRQTAHAIAGRIGLALQPGKMVMEVKTAGADNGMAVRALMAESPLREGRPLFVGDDETDEAGFRAAADLGGAGILVGETRATAAAFYLPGVDETLAWLEEAVAACA